MSFKVDEEDIGKFAVQLGRLAEDSEQARRYVSQHVNSDIATGAIGSALIGLVGSPHESVVQRVKDALQKIQEISTGCERELSSASKYYMQTDEDNAAKVDATYPKSKRT